MDPICALGHVLKHYKKANGEADLLNEWLGGKTKSEGKKKGKAKVALAKAAAPKQQGGKARRASLVDAAASALRRLRRGSRDADSEPAALADGHDSPLFDLVSA